MSTWRVDQTELRDMVKACAADREMPARVLAAALNVKTEVVHALLAGNRQWWLEAVETMADLFEMSVDELVGDGVTPKRRADIKRGRQAREIPATEVVKGKLRTLCCSCGTMTRIKRVDFIRDQCDPNRRSPMDSSWVSAHHTADRINGNSMALADCVTCKRETPHAVLDDHSKPDWQERIEQYQRGTPSADRVAQQRLSELVARLIGFGIDVSWKTRKARKDTGVAPVLSVQCMDEKARSWRISLNGNYPANVVIDNLTEVWRAIADADTSWWTQHDLVPTDSVVVFPDPAEITTAIDGLIDEIHKAAPAVLTSIVLDASDREVDQ